MYVREKKLRRGEKTYSYWQLVQGTRVDGKVKQQVVAHIGAADDRPMADRLARSKGLLCCAIGCGNAAVEELEYQGLRPTHTIPFPGGRKVEFSYAACLDHLEAWRCGERFNAFPLIHKTLEGPK